MSFSVGLYPDFARKGGIPFNSLPTAPSSGCDCNPEGDRTEHVSRPELQVPLEPRNVAAEDVQGDLDEISAMISEGSPTR
jgi:hypothetical protein